MSEEELATFEENKIELKKKLILADHGELEDLKNYDPLSEIEEPPPTFRAWDERRYAQFQEILFGIGRLHNFQKKISGLKASRVEFLAEQSLFSDVLTALHRSSFSFEIELDDLEGDMDKTAKLLKTYDIMEKLWMQASRIERQAGRDRKKAEMRHCGLWADVKEQGDVNTFIREETRALLKMKMTYECKYQDTVVAIGDCRSVVATAYSTFIDTESDVNYLLYCKPGNYVNTRYGFGRICSYRALDQMILIVLPFGQPSAKLWIHSKEVVHAERSQQHGERMLMDLEDNYMRKITNIEQNLMRKELFLMRNEEVGLKEYLHFIDFMKVEDDRVKAGLEVSIAKTYALIDTKKFRDIADESTSVVIKKKVKMNAEAIKLFKGPKTARPKKLTGKDLMAVKKEVELELKQKFLAKVCVFTFFTQLCN